VHDSVPGTKRAYRDDLLLSAFVVEAEAEVALRKAIEVIKTETNGDRAAELLAGLSERLSSVQPAPRMPARLQTLDEQFLDFVGGSTPGFASVTRPQPCRACLTSSPERRRRDPRRFHLACAPSLAARAISLPPSLVAP
jgi:hypothetical protein